jgi:isopentenyl-diphosphate Delta-isomerase
MAADVDFEPNPEEVDAVKYVTLAELQEMMEPSSGLLWSPWFA